MKDAAIGFLTSRVLVAGDPSRPGTLIYIVTVEISRPSEARDTSLYVLVVVTLRRGEEKHTHLHNCCGNLTNVCVYILHFHIGFRS